MLIMKIAFETPSKQIIVKYFKRILFVLLIFFCCTCSYFIYSQNKIITSMKNDLSQIVESQNSLSFESSIVSEGESYKLLYENIKYSNDKILDTVYWSLSAILVVMIALIGAQVFSNYRFNKKEIENMIISLNAQTEDIKNKTFQEIQEKLNKYMETNRLGIKEDFKGLSAAQQEQIIRYSESTNLLVNTLNNSFNERNENLKKSIESSAIRIQTNKSELTKLINNSDKLLKIDIHDIRAQIWELRKVNANVLAEYIRKALLEIDMEKDLERSLRLIEEKLVNMGEIPSSYQSNLYDLLRKVPPKYEIQLERINTLLKSLPVK